MTDSCIAARARSFGAVADCYERFRPAPPGQAVDWALPTGAIDVLDLGAGTGAATRLLRERVPGKVVAVEPDARMRAVLVRRVPDVLAVGAVLRRSRSPMPPSTRSLSRRHGTGWISP